MLRHIQKVRGSDGDCFRTALACLLDVERLEDVPHFFDGKSEATEEEKAANWAAVREWLLVNKGLFMVTIPYSSQLVDLLDCMKLQNPGVYYLLSGHSGVDNHVVVCFEDQVVHDPCGYPAGKDCLVGPCSDGFYWVKFFLPRFHGSAS